jgi:phage FluMu gp28-like protein
MKSVNDKLQNHRDVYRRNAEFTYNTNNPIYFGVDVAEKTDYFAVSGYEEIVTSDGRVYYIERWLDYFNNTETPELEKYLDVIFEIYPTLVKMRIDSTGLGSYLPSYLKKRHGGKVEGINFARTVFAEDGKEKVGIKKIMCTNLKRLLEDDQVILLPDEMQSKHLGAVDYSFSVKKGVEGHGDIFFSNALALLKSRYSVGKQEVQMNTPQQKEQDISKMGVLERIKYYKKKGGKI